MNYKNVSIIFGTLFLACCGASQGIKEDDINVDNANQHVALGVTLATFYCKKHRWPADIHEIREYSESESLPLPVKINWVALNDPRTVFTITEKVKVRIPKEVIETPGNAVSSINSYPECSGKDVKVNVHLNIGE